MGEGARRPGELVEHFFRHESGRLVGLLTRALGVTRLDLVEDVVQSALLQALHTWARQGVPDDPAGWLYRTARNRALDAIRRERVAARILPEIGAGWVQAEEAEDEPRFAEEIGDEPLRLLFLCCHEAIPAESRVALALRTVCGFGTAEIARGLLTSEANVQKRIVRAKERLREEPGAWEAPGLEPLRGRLPAVQAAIYLLFNEGYSVASGDELIRRDLCGEALRLGRMLASHPVGDEPAQYALVALLCFQAARLEARDDSGRLILLEEQDRARWDWGLVREGMAWMERSAAGSVVSRYHVEAAIAWEHCRARSFGETDWERIIGLYEVLRRVTPSAVLELNRAIAVSYRDGPAAGLAVLAAVAPERIPARYPLWPAVAGELRLRAGDRAGAEQSFQEALAMQPARGDAELIARRLEACRGGGSTSPGSSGP